MKLQLLNCETVHICSLSQQSLMTKGPVIVYRPRIGEFRGKAINNDHPLINQETKEIKTSVFLIHRVAVTITTRSFASGRRNIFMHLHVLSKHFDTHKITEKRWRKKANVCYLDLELWSRYPHGNLWFINYIWQSWVKMKSRWAAKIHLPSIV